MKTSIPQLTKLPAWQALEAHYQKIQEVASSEALRGRSKARGAHDS